MSPPILDHLRSRLEWLDLLLHREILRLRASYQLSLDELRGLYVSGHNRPVDWDRVTAAGHRFAYVAATTGSAIPGRCII